MPRAVRAISSGDFDPGLNGYGSGYSKSSSDRNHLSARRYVLEILAALFCGQTRVEFTASYSRVIQNSAYRFRLQSSRRYLSRNEISAIIRDELRSPISEQTVMTAIRSLFERGEINLSSNQLGYEICPNKMVRVI